ncbi:hypothetical protein [Pseudomonas sp. RC10]|uniref:hypothetical protein n=1 Tax=Pseudomonas bambusae TaxID=3139142 RepID=UPI003138A33F
MSTTQVGPEKAVATHLKALRRTIRALAKLRLSQIHELSGHQTVDSRQSLLLSFERLEACLSEMEETLATLTEATESG